MFKKKIKQQVIIPEDNGKDKKISPMVTNPDLIREIVSGIDKMQSQQLGQADKYAIVRDLSDPSLLKYHSELEKEEIDILDNNEMWCDLAPIVFSSADSEVKKLVDIIRGHGTEHRTNKVSYKRKRELSIVYAIKADVGVPSVENKVKQVMGIKT